MFKGESMDASGVPQRKSPLLCTCQIGSSTAQDDRNMFDSDTPKLVRERERGGGMVMWVWYVGRRTGT